MPIRRAYRRSDRESPCLRNQLSPRRPHRVTGHLSVRFPVTRVLCAPVHMGITFTNALVIQKIPEDPISFIQIFIIFSYYVLQFNPCTHFLSIFPPPPVFFFFFNFPAPPEFSPFPHPALLPT